VSGEDACVRLFNLFIYCFCFLFAVDNKREPEKESERAGESKNRSDAVSPGEK